MLSSQVKFSAVRQTDRQTDRQTAIKRYAPDLLMQWNKKGHNSYWSKNFDGCLPRLLYC